MFHCVEEEGFTVAVEVLLGSSVPLWEEVQCNLVYTVILGKLGRNVARVG